MKLKKERSEEKIHCYSCFPPSSPFAYKRKGLIGGTPRGSRDAELNLETSKSLALKIHAQKSKKCG